VVGFILLFARFAGFGILDGLRDVVCCDMLIIVLRWLWFLFDIEAV